MTAIGIPQRLDDIVSRIDCIRHDINVEYRRLPGDAPLFACTDIVIALGHLRLAAVALDKATDTLDSADVQAVTR